MGRRVLSIPKTKIRNPAISLTKDFRGVNWNTLIRGGEKSLPEDHLEPSNGS
jgi:hypothetical protein